MAQVLKTERISSRVEGKFMEKMSQNGSFVGSFTPKYKSFPTAFSAVPTVVIAPKGAGTITSFRVNTIALGSFSFRCQGTPIAVRNTAAFNYIAYGSV